MRGRWLRGPTVRERGVWDADRVQAAMNVVGGGAFAVGSLLFLDDSLMRVGIALFVVGSLAMAGGAVLVWLERYGRPAGGSAAAPDRGARAPRHELREARVDAPGTPPLAASAATGVGEDDPGAVQLYLVGSYGPEPDLARGDMARGDVARGDVARTDGVANTVVGNTAVGNHALGREASGDDGPATDEGDADDPTPDPAFRPLLRAS